MVQGNGVLDVLEDMLHIMRRPLVQNSEMKKQVKGRRRGKGLDARKKLKMQKASRRRNRK